MSPRPHQHQLQHQCRSIPYANLLLYCSARKEKEGLFVSSHLISSRHPTLLIPPCCIMPISSLCCCVYVFVYYDLPCVLVPVECLFFVQYVNALVVINVCTYVLTLSYGGDRSSSCESLPGVPLKKNASRPSVVPPSCPPG